MIRIEVTQEDIENSAGEETPVVVALRREFVASSMLSVFEDGLLVYYGAFMAMSYAVPNAEEFFSANKTCTEPFSFELGEVIDHYVLLDGKMFILPKDTWENNYKVLRDYQAQFSLVSIVETMHEFAAQVGTAWMN